MKRLYCIVTSVLLVFFTQTSSAADLRVRVFERGASKPLSGVSVCLGTQARIDQFGAKKTDINGYVVFDSLPQAQLLVTATKAGYMGEQELMITSNANRMLVLSLVSGGGGPACNAVGTASAVLQNGLQVTHFTIDRGAAKAASRRVTLDHSLSGTVTQYRASELADFGDTDWQDYSGVPVFELSSGNGTKRVYFQVRRHSTINDAVVETLSPVVHDSVIAGDN
jgi:hypothetical protein